MQKEYFDISLNEDNVAFEEIVNKVKTTHDLTMNEICEILRCRRTYINMHIAKKVEKVKITNSWSTILKAQGVIKTSDTTFFNRECFGQFLDQTLISIKRKTILLDKKIIMDNVQTYMEKVDEINKEITGIMYEISINNSCESIEKIRKLKKRKYEIWKNNLNELGKKIALDLPKISNLTKIKAVDITDKERDKYKNFKFFASSDFLDGYGDDDSNVKRKLFKMGFATIEFKFDKDIKKLYYLPEKMNIDIINDVKAMDKFWLCKYQLYKENKEEIEERTMHLSI